MFSPERGMHDPGKMKRRKLLLRYALAIIFLGFILTTVIWLLGSAWQRRASSSDFERTSQSAASYPMRIAPLITGNDKATSGELVYLARVLLKSGPTPKTFFLIGSRGTRVLALADAAHVSATPGGMVDVRGTIRQSPSAKTLRAKWNIGLADARQLATIPIYIDAEFIRQSED